jgi:hypothetical protein
MAFGIKRSSVSSERICPNCKGKGTVKTKKPRSLSQNKYYWGVVVLILSTEIGEDKDTMHEVLKMKFLSEKIIMPDMTVTPIGRSTSELSTVNFEEFVKTVQMWASSEMNIYIPKPNEVTDETFESIQRSYESLFY